MICPRSHTSENWFEVWLIPKSICFSHSTGQPPSRNDPKHIINEKGEGVKTIISRVKTLEHSPLQEINPATTPVHAIEFTSYLFIPQNNLIISSHQRTWNCCSSAQNCSLATLKKLTKRFKLFLENPYQRINQGELIHYPLEIDTSLPTQHLKFHACLIARRVIWSVLLACTWKWGRRGRKGERETQRERVLAGCVCLTHYLFFCVGMFNHL